MSTGTPDSKLDMRKDTATDVKGQTETKETKEPEDELMSLLKGISMGMENLTKEVSTIKGRVDGMENGNRDEFKKHAKPEDIETLGNRTGVDPKISAMVDEMLGADFGVQIRALGDQPGFRMTLIVPPRLSDNIRDRRPLREFMEDGVTPTGKYVKNEAGEVKFEDYVPEDRRSRVLASSDSYDVVRQHCERVRSHIVSYFQKVNKPLPEFKVK